MTNASKFIAVFNAIEHRLRDIVGCTGKVHLPFYKLIEISKPKNSVVRRNEQHLRKFGSLRNAIVHEQFRPGYVIAEPHDDVVALIEAINRDLTTPELVLPRFRRQVETLCVSNTLSDVLSLIRLRSYSQFPVYDNGKFVGVITDNGITNWLANHVHDDIISLSESYLVNVVELEECKNNHSFVSADTSIFEVKDLFTDQFEHDTTNFAAVLITQDGGEDEPLLGIVTAWDVVTSR